MKHTHTHTHTQSVNNSVSHYLINLRCIKDSQLAIKIKYRTISSVSHGKGFKLVLRKQPVPYDDSKPVPPP